MNFDGPLLLKNTIQNYSWGTKNDDAFIPHLLGILPEKRLNYAELWMGAHPSAPSLISGEKLDDMVDRYPEEIIGHSVKNQKFPFLFKVLSANEALSIQAHPNKMQAELLHKADPKNYPDDNHKPEIAVALDKLTALAGFPAFAELKSTLQHYPEMAEFIGEAAEAILDSEPGNLKDKQDLIRQGYTALMENAVSHRTKLAEALKTLEQRLESSKSELNEQERLFFQLREKYGNDVGLFSLFYLKYLELDAGEAVYLPAGIPHAYLKGNIIECMANSDNVVRAGLTGKFVDIPNLLKILNRDITPIEILDYDRNSVVYDYPSPAAEFQVSRIRLRKAQKLELLNRKTPGIIIITKGELEMHTQDNGKEIVKIAKRGEAYLLPACLSNIRLSAETDTLAFMATMP